MSGGAKRRGRYRVAAVLLSGLLFVATAGEGAAAERIDLALVIAVDVSTSMDQDEKQMQQRGFVEAFRRPEIIDAICGGAAGRIAVAYVEWGGIGPQKMVVPWTLIASEADAWSFSLKLEANVPTRLRRGTSLSGALGYASGLLHQTGYEAARSVVNVSGDGVNNIGPDLGPVRAELLAEGITINGLSILYGKGSEDGEKPLPPAELYAYFEREVIGGPGAFAMPVTSFADYPQAIYRKLLREIGDRGADVALIARPSRPPGAATR
jgi:hypothetical protein